ncbi:DnaJ C-terminal domain-containing protein, partial [Brevundimonas sp.]|uniref:DnaJ C-terminal domain-containing protein n=1 Tax=Brevundimonas sp. TaxID=1871086 RepID=UPI0035196FCB
LRAGEHVRLKGAGRDDSDLFLAVRIRAADGLSVLGDDLFMQADVSPRVLKDGGRVELLTHAGPRNAWVVAGLEPPVRLRLKGLGLPARGRHAQGHLFITLTPAEEAPSAAEHLLDRFARVWTTAPLAA